MRQAKANIALGLEIDAGVARAVELKGSFAAPVLSGLASVELPLQAFSEGMIVQPDEVARALTELFKRGRVRHRQVVLGVSNQAVLVRHTLVPKAPKDKLDNVIRFHAQELLPIPLESVVMDYVVIGERVDETATELEVLLVAARLDMLDTFMDVLEKARLEPLDVDVSALVLRHILPASAKERTVAVLNVANGPGNILVSEKNVPRLARLVNVKISDLAEQTGVSIENALEEATFHDYYKIWLRNLVSETRSSLTYFQNQSGLSNIEAIVLNGRGARLPGIAASLEGSLGLPVRITNPLAAIAGASRFSGLKGLEAADYAISAGLALRGLKGA